MNAKKGILRILCFLVCFFIFAASVTVLMPDSFSNSYQRVLVTQYDYFNSIEENKVVFIGNSSLAFGFDQDLMEDLTGKPCPLLGNHAGHGLTFVMEMSKTNLRSGDAVVIEFVNNEYNQCGMVYILTGIGNRYDMYKIFFPQLKKEIFKGFVSGVKKKLENNLAGGFEIEEPSYTFGAFSDKGGMTLLRKEIYAAKITEESVKTFDDVNFNSDFIAYVNSYVDYCKSIGVDVYFTIPCYMDEAVTANKDTIEKWDKNLSSQLNAPLISNSNDYIFERKYIYNSIAHCNSEGAIVRTKQLYDDLKDYIS